MIEYLELSHETKLQLFTEKMSKLSQIRIISRIHGFCRSCGLPTHAACVHTTARTAGNPAWVRLKTVANGALVAGGDGAVLLKNNEKHSKFSQSASFFSYRVMRLSYTSYGHHGCIIVWCRRVINVSRAPWTTLVLHPGAEWLKVCSSAHYDDKRPQMRLKKRSKPASNSKIEKPY